MYSLVQLFDVFTFWGTTFSTNRLLTGKIFGIPFSWQAMSAVKGQHWLSPTLFLPLIFISRIKLFLKGLNFTHCLKLGLIHLLNLSTYNINLSFTEVLYLMTISQMEMANMPINIIHAIWICNMGGLYQWISKHICVGPRQVIWQKNRT